MTRRLALMVEGQSDESGIHALTRRVVTDVDGWDAVYLPDDAMRIGCVHAVAKDNFGKWKRMLGNALCRNNIGGVIVVLDGDVGCFPAGTETAFCAATVARELANIAAREVGIGQRVSLAVTFACMEVETWLMAGVESLAGKPLPDGRAGIRADTVPPDGNLELAPRGAKGWLGTRMPGGYSETRDQAALAEMVDLQVVRQRNLRSFQRFEKAVQEVVEACRTGNHICTPC